MSIESTMADLEQVQKLITSHLANYRYLCFRIRSVKKAQEMVVDDMLRRVCSSDQIKEDTMQFFAVEHIEVIVGRKRGKLFAFNNSCPHRGASLSKGELKDNRIVCYMHGYEYDIFTGRLENMKSWKKEKTWIEQNPEWRKSGNLTIYPVVEENGSIFLII